MNENVGGVVEGEDDERIKRVVGEVARRFGEHEVVFTDSFFVRLGEIVRQYRAYVRSEVAAFAAHAGRTAPDKADYLLFARKNAALRDALQALPPNEFTALLETLSPSVFEL